MKFFKISQVSYFIWFMFSLFLLSVLVSGYVLWQAHASFDWPTTKGMVVNTWIEEIHTQGSSADPHYEVGIEYVYAVGEDFYHKKNKRDITGAIPGYSEEEAQALVAEFPRTKIIHVHYDPDDPESAVIIPTIHIFMIIGFVLFSLIFLAVLYVMLRQMTSEPDSFIVTEV